MRDDLVPVAFHVREGEGLGKIVEGDWFLNVLSDISPEGFEFCVELDASCVAMNTAEWQAEPDAVIGVSCAAEQVEILIVADGYEPL